MLKKKFPREMGSQRMIMKDRVPSELISWASSWSAGLSKLKVHVDSSQIESSRDRDSTLAIIRHSEAF